MFRYGYFLLNREQEKFDWNPKTTSESVIASFSMYRNGSKENILYPSFF